MIRTTIAGILGIIISVFPYNQADSDLLEKGELPKNAKYVDNIIVVTNRLEAPPYQTGISSDGYAVTGVSSVDWLCRKFKVVKVEPFYNGTLRKTALIREVSKIYLFTFADGINPLSIIKQFNDDPNIEMAEPYVISEPLYEPNDPYLDQQWHLGHTHVLEAWDMVRGDTTRHSIIAIVDNGVNWNHIDLSENIWVNEQEDLNSNGTIDDDDLNGIDDDGNGFIDDVVGWDFGQDDNYPMPDTSLHGTGVAGCASEVTDNGVLGAGMGFSARIMCVKGRLWSREIEYYYQGMIYAADNGAQIINCSWATDIYAQYQQNIINVIWEEDVLIIAGAGNGGNDQEKYPAAYEHVMAAAGTDQDDVIANFSSYGTWVDICAPAVDIWKTSGDDDYEVGSGTSYASPLTAGLAALLRTHFPDFSNDEIEQLIEVSADPIDHLNPDYEGLLGAGRINAMTSVMTAIEEGGEKPSEFSLSQNYPNPFNAMTVIRYSLPEPSDVVIEIYDILGRRVETLVNEEQPAGYHQIIWDAEDASSGMYFYRIQAGDYIDTRKMLLIK